MQTWVLWGPERVDTLTINYVTNFALAGLLGQLKTQLGWFQMSHAICLSKLVSYPCKGILEIPIACKIISYKIIILMVAWWFVITLLSIDNFNLFIFRSKWLWQRWCFKLFELLDLKCTHAFWKVGSSGGKERVWRKLVSGSVEGCMIKWR